jgi:hypothetical protein
MRRRRDQLDRRRWDVIIARLLGLIILNLMLDTRPCCFRFGLSKLLVSVFPRELGAFGGHIASMQETLGWLRIDGCKLRELLGLLTLASTLANDIV